MIPELNSRPRLWATWQEVTSYSLLLLLFCLYFVLLVFVCLVGCSVVGFWGFLFVCLFVCLFVVVFLEGDCFVLFCFCIFRGWGDGRWGGGGGASLSEPNKSASGLSVFQVSAYRYIRFRLIGISGFGLSVYQVSAYRYFRFRLIGISGFGLSVFQASNSVCEAVLGVVCCCNAERFMYMCGVLLCSGPGPHDYDQGQASRHVGHSQEHSHDHDHDHDHHDHLALSAGLGIGMTLLIAAAIVFVVIFYRRYRKAQKAASSNALTVRMGALTGETTGGPAWNQHTAPAPPQYTLSPNDVMSPPLYSSGDEALVTMATGTQQAGDLPTKAPLPK